jgi:hypothetical protein
MTPTRFERAVPTSERPQTHALDSAVTVIGLPEIMSEKYFPFLVKNESLNLDSFIR